MDSRRTRGRPKDMKDSKESSKKSEVKKNSVRSSPSRRASPSRRSSPPSTRKSPSRRASPGRRASPTRRTSPPPRPSSTTSTRSSRQRSTAVVTPTPVVVPPSPIKEKKEPKASPKAKLETTNATSINENITKSASTTTTTTTSSIHSTISISTQKTTDVGTSKNISGDSEVAKLTDFIRRSVSKTFSSSQRGGSQTPSTHASQISRSVSQSVYDDGDNYSKMEFSDSEEENFRSVNVTTRSTYTPLLQKSSSICRKIEVPKEFGGLLGASILLLTVPILSYYLPWCCKKGGCEFRKPNLSALLDLKYLEKVFDGKAVGSYVAFTSGVFVLSAALFGRFVRLPGERIGSGYHFNGFPIAVLAVIGMAVGEYYEYPVMEFILKNYMRYCLYSILNALLAAIWCYVRSNYIAGYDTQLNPYAKSGNFIVDFCLGRQINPKWFGKVDIKLVYYKISLILTLLFALSMNLHKTEIKWPTETPPPGGDAADDFVFLAKSFIKSLKYNTYTMYTSDMLAAYAADAIVFEHHLASSFELQQEGVGALLLLRYAATPFFLGAVPKFFYDQRPMTSADIPDWAFYCMAVLFLTGLALKRLSCKQKYNYRINPNLQQFVGVETVHTFQGRRLLVGNLWGWVRQPNSLGELMALSAFTVPLYFKFAGPPLVCVLLFIAIVLHRAVRANTRNSTRYHSSWVRYCMKVKYMVVPKIF